MRSYLAMVRSGLKSFIRDKSGLFWSFFFPVFFLIIFGSIMNRKDDDIRVPVRIVMEDDSPIVSWLPGVFAEIKALDSKVTDLASAKAELAKSKSRAVLVIHKGAADNFQNHKPMSVTIYVDQTSPQMGTMAASILRSTLDAIEKKSAKTPQMFAINSGSLKETETEKKPASGINALLPGIVAMTIMQLGLFSALPFIVMREKGILKRLRATPLPRSTVIASQVTQRLTIAFLQTGVILVLGALMFQFQMQGSWISLIGLVIFGTLMFICMGAVLSSVAKTQETGVSMVQLINMPMMFLSGFFFPSELLPSFMQPIVKVIPSTYMADLLRNVMVGSPLNHPVGMELGIMSAWLIGGFLMAVKKFRWE